MGVRLILSGYADATDLAHSADLADSANSADLADSTDSADLADLTDSLVFSIKRFLSFIYSATKGFISSSKLSSELKLAKGGTTNKEEGKVYAQVLTIWSIL